MLLLTALVAVAAMFVGYSGAYFALGERTDWPMTPLIQRAFRQQWTPPFFQPAGWVESKLRGVDVQVTHAE